MPARPVPSTSPARVAAARSSGSYESLGSGGAAVTVRTLGEGRAAPLLELLDRLSPRTVRGRFHGCGSAGYAAYVDELLDPSCTFDAVEALVSGTVVGIGSTHPVAGDVAEVSVVVDDAHQHRGTGGLLLEDLVERSTRRGLRRLVAWVAHDNTAMLDVLYRSGLPLSTRLEGDCVEVTMRLARDPGLREAVTPRERQAVRASLRRLLEPGSVAVVGAGSRREGVGRQVLDNLRSAGFPGRLYAVNRSGTALGGIPAYRRVLDLPHGIDLVVVAVPKDAVLPVVRQCAQRSVGAVVVLTSGFAECDADADQDELRAVCRRAGIRLTGPNCVGVANTDPLVALDASFLPRPPSPGPVVVATQCGAVGAGLLDLLGRQDVGVRTFVSLGNASDVGAADVVAYAGDDPVARVVALYLESVTDPVALHRMAESVGRGLPVVLLKAGRTAPGADAAHDHSGAAGDDDAAVDALCRDSGITRVGSLTELADTVALHACQPAPRGRRVAVVGNSGGMGVLALDAAADVGLQPPDLTQHTMMRLQHELPALATVGRQVDATSAATAAQLAAAVETLAEDPGVDAVVVVGTATPHLPAAEVQAAVEDVSARHPRTTTVLCLADRACVPGARVPVVDDPRRAIVAVANAAQWHERRDRVARREPEPLPPASARAVVDVALAGSATGGWLSPDDTAALLRSYDLPIRPPADEEAAAHAVPVLGLPDALELTVEGLRLRRWGPLVVLGRGGGAADADPDRQCALAPVGAAQVADLLHGLRCAAGMPDVADLTSPQGHRVTELVAAASRLVAGLPEVTDLRLDRVVLTDHGPIVVDARVRVAPAWPSAADARDSGR